MTGPRQHGSAFFFSVVLSSFYLHGVNRSKCEAHPMMRMNNQAIQSPKETEYKCAGDTNNECSRSSQDNFIQYKKISDPL